MSSKFNEIYENSIKNPEKFWKEASEDIFWFKKPTKILNKSNPPFYKCCLLYTSPSPRDS